MSRTLPPSTTTTIVTARVADDITFPLPGAPDAAGNLGQRLLQVFQDTDFPSINAAVDRFNQHPDTQFALVVTKSNSISSTLTVPANLELVFIAGGLLTGNGAPVTVTFLAGSRLTAGAVMIFDTLVTVTGTPQVNEICSEWFASTSAGIFAIFAAAFPKALRRGGNVQAPHYIGVRHPINASSVPENCFFIDPVSNWLKFRTVDGVSRTVVLDPVPDNPIVPR
jgi:hypothetical protein